MFIRTAWREQGLLKLPSGVSNRPKLGWTCHLGPSDINRLGLRASALSPLPHQPPNIDQLRGPNVGWPCDSNLGPSYP